MDTPTSITTGCSRGCVRWVFDGSRRVTVYLGLEPVRFDPGILEIDAADLGAVSTFLRACATALEAEHARGL